MTIQHKKILIFNWMEIDLTHHPSRYVCVYVCVCLCVSIDQQQSIQRDATKEITPLLHPCLLLPLCDIGLSPPTTLPLELPFSSLHFHSLSSSSFFLSLFKTMKDLGTGWPVFNRCAVFFHSECMKHSSATAEAPQKKMQGCVLLANFCTSVTCSRLSLLMELRNLIT